LSGPLLGGTCLSRALHDVGLSIVIPRARQACPSDHFSARRDLLVRAVSRRDPLVRSFFRRDRLVGSAFSEGPACRVRFFGGTRLSGPPTNVGSSIAFAGGLKSRAESGAKAPHSIWSAAIHRRFWVKALAFTTSPIALFSRASDQCPLVGAIHELPLPLTWRTSSNRVGAAVWTRRNDRTPGVNF